MFKIKPTTAIYTLILMGLNLLSACSNHFTPIEPLPNYSSLKAQGSALVIFDRAANNISIDDSKKSNSEWHYLKPGRHKIEVSYYRYPLYSTSPITGDGVFKAGHIYLINLIPTVTNELGSAFIIRSDDITVYGDEKIFHPVFKGNK